MFTARRHFTLRRCVCRWTTMIESPRHLLGKNYGTYNGTSFTRKARRTRTTHDDRKPPYSTGQNISVDSATTIREEGIQGRSAGDNPWASKKSAAFTPASRNLHTERFFKHDPEIARIRRHLQRRSHGFSDSGHKSDFGHTDRALASGAPPPTPGAEDYYLTWLETQLMHGLRMESKTTFRVVASSVFLGCTLMTVAFWKEIKQFFVGQTSEVAGTVLSTEDVQIKASDFAKAVLNQIMTDPLVYQRAITFLQKIVGDPATQAGFQALISNALQSKQVRSALYDLLSDDYTINQLKILLINIVQQEASQRALLDLLLWAVQQQETKQSLQELLSSLFRDQYLVDEGSNYLTQALHQTLSDEGVKEHAVHFVNSALTDEALQKQGGDALWKAFTYSISPRWFSKDHERDGKLVSPVMSPNDSTPETSSKDGNLAPEEESKNNGTADKAASDGKAASSHRHWLDNSRKPHTESLLRVEESSTHLQQPSLPKDLPESGGEVKCTHNAAYDSVSEIQRRALERFPDLVMQRRDEL